MTEGIRGQRRIDEDRGGHMRTEEAIGGQMTTEEDRGQANVKYK